MTRREDTLRTKEETIVFEELESWVRGRIQNWIQAPSCDIVELITPHEKSDPQTS